MGRKRVATEAFTINLHLKTRLGLVESKALSVGSNIMNDIRRVQTEKSTKGEVYFTRSPKGTLYLLNKQGISCPYCGEYERYGVMLDNDMICTDCETPVVWWDRQFDYVPTELEMINYLKDQLSIARYELREAENTIEYGHVPDATNDIVSELYQQININRQKVDDVIDELFRDNGFGAVRSVA